MIFIMTKIKLLTISVIGLIALNLVSLVLHFYDRPPKPINQGFPKPQNAGPRAIIIERLSFDSTQINAYDQLILAHRRGVKEKDSLLSALKTKFFQTLVNNDSAEKKIIGQQISEVQKAIEDVHYTHLMAVKQLCKANQLAAFNNLTNEFAAFFSPEKRRDSPNDKGRRGLPPQPNEERREPPPPGEDDNRRPPPPGEEGMPPPSRDERNDNRLALPKENK